MSKPVNERSAYAAMTRTLLDEAQELRNADRGICDISLVDIATLICNVRIAAALDRLSRTMENKL